MVPGLKGETDKFYRCDVIFGSPSADCRGTGICKIVAEADRGLGSEKKECKRTQAMFAGNAGDDSLSLLLFPEFLCIHILKNHLRKGVLEMPEACPIPTEMASTMGLNEKEIPAGTYAVEMRLGYYKITLLGPANQ